MRSPITRIAAVLVSAFMAPLGIVAAFPAGAAATTSTAAGITPVLLDPSSGCGPAVDQLAATDCQPPTVAAYGGWAAWSRSDATTGEFALVLRSPHGTVSLAQVAERSSPFDVQLGPTRSGIAAVYSRCSNTVTLQGCGIDELSLGKPGARETALAVPGGGSVHEPAISGRRIVFLRRNASGGREDPFQPGRRPDGLFTWQVGDRRPQALTLPVSRGANGVAAHWPRGLTGVVGGLTLDGERLAYTTSTESVDSGAAFGMFTLWSQRLGHAPEVVDQATAGAGNVCLPMLLSPVLSGGWLYAYLHACDPSANPALDRWTRYSLTAHGTQRAKFSFVSHGDDAIYSVVPDAGGVDWDNGGVHRLGAVAWRVIPRPVPQTFCTRADPFC